MEQTDFNHPRRKRFRVPIDKARSFQAAQLRGIKADSYIFLKKTMGIKTRMHNVWQAEFFKWLKRNL
jgi:hypothetical protein